MRCVYCGKPLGRFRKTTGEFCSEEHRSEYRDQIERAALERLLISRKKLTSNQKDPVAPTIVAELIQPALSPLSAAGLHAEVWPIPANSASLFPSSGGIIYEPGLRVALLSMSHCLPQSRRQEPGATAPMEAPNTKVLLPANGIRPNSLGLRSAVDQLPLARTLPGAASRQPVTCEIEVKPEPFTRLLHLRHLASRLPIPISPSSARSVKLALQPKPPRTAPLAEEVIQPRDPPDPWIGSAGFKLRTSGFDLCKPAAAQMASRRKHVQTARAEPIASCDSPRLLSLRAGARSCRLPVAPMVSMSITATLPAVRTDASSAQLPLTTASILLPGTRTSRSADAESGIPDRLDELKELSGPAPFRADEAIAGGTPAVFDPQPLPSLPEMPIKTAEAALPQWTGLRSLGLPDAVKPRTTPINEDTLALISSKPSAGMSLGAAGASARATMHPGTLLGLTWWRTLSACRAHTHVGTCGAIPFEKSGLTLPALPHACLQPFAGAPLAASFLIRLSLPTVAPGTLKKTAVPTDGDCKAANARPIYPLPGLQLQPGWNAARSRLVRVYAAVPARRGAVELRGQAEPADASVWQAPLNPPARLFPAAGQAEERTSSESPGEANPARRFAGIGPLLRFWEGSHRGLKGGVIVFSCMLAFGLHSAVSNPQPVSATARDAEFAAITGPLRVLQESVVRRAGVHLADDFRTGLHAWEGGGDWSDSWSYDQAGFVHPGRLALYTPSLGMSDYRMEFVGQINKKGLSWAVRAADVNNYMAVKLVHVKTGPIPRLAILRYAVVNGKEERHKQVSFPFEARTDTVYNIRMEVRGERFSLFIQDRIADSWEEDRLESGGVGFFSSKGEDARLRWVRLTYQYDWVGRICAALAG